MQINYGSIIAYNYSANTYKFINNGTIRGLNNVTVNASVLTGNGSISSGNNMFIKSSNFGYAGTISSSNACEIEANKFEGCATINSPIITIKCEDFNFTGTLFCDQQCVIYAKNEFDVTKFSKKGKGSLKVVISPHEVEVLDGDKLCSKSFDAFCSKGLNLTQDDIDNVIKKTRSYAVLNFLDDKAVLENIKTRALERANFHKDKMNERRDTSFLHSGLAKTGLTMVGLGIAYAMLRNEERLNERVNNIPVKVVASVLGGLSAFSAIASVSDFYSWIYPKHREKHAVFALITDRINQSLATQRVPEEKIFVY